MTFEISNLFQKLPKQKCDGNVCINKSETIEVIALEKFLYIQLCGNCQRLRSLTQQIGNLGDTIQLITASKPFKKWEDKSQLDFNGVIITRLLKKILKRLNEVYDLISSIWYGLGILETNIENIIYNIHLVEKLGNN